MLPFNQILMISLVCYLDVAKSVEFLIQKNASVNHKNAKGYEPIHTAAEYGKY